MNQTNKSLAFLVSKFKFTSLLAQVVSNLSANLWKVVMKCKSIMFFNFRARFFKMYIFEVAIFFLAKYLSNQPDFLNESTYLLDLCFW